VNGTIITTIALKELREAFRDRRTLFLMVFLPVLLYPALVLLITQVASVQVEQLEARDSVVALIGAEHEPSIADVLEATERIAVRRFAAEVFAAELGAERGSGQAEHPARDPRSLGVDLVIELHPIPPEPDARYASHPVSAHFLSVSEESRQALDRVEVALQAWARATLDGRLERASLPAQFTEPLALTLENHATEQAQGGYLLGSILPMFIIVTVLLGAYYPAIDLTAGEKERGSIQTLFTAPIRTVDIVAGKYLAVVAIAMVSGLANLGSIVLVVGQGMRLAGDLASEFDLSLTAPVIIALFWNIILIALFFSALLLSVAVLARSFKEAQTYISPVYLLCIVPAMIAQLPGFDYTPQLGIVPAVGTILLMKQILLEGVHLDALFYTSVSTFAWTGLALLAAASLFGREDVVFGERASLTLIPRRRDMQPSARPSLGFGVAWCAVGFVLLFYVGASLQTWSPQVGLALTLWAVLLAPTLGVAWFAKLKFRTTFALRRPTATGWAATVLLAVSSLVVVNALNGLIDQHLLPTPPELAEQMAAFFPRPESALDWVLLIALVGISPAICEEAIFRGFLFSSLRDRVPTAVLIGGTALAFGLFHLSIYRLFGTTALGVVMGLLVWRTRSIYTSALFHAINNSLALVGAFALSSSDALELELPSWAIALASVGMLAGFALLWRIPLADETAADDAIRST
jgi:sodium transport system permease protein